MSLASSFPFVGLFNRIGVFFTKNGKMSSLCQILCREGKKGGDVNIYKEKATIRDRPCAPDRSFVFMPDGSAERRTAESRRPLSRG